MARSARRAGPTLRLPDRLLDALAVVEGEPLDRARVVERIAAGVTRLSARLVGEPDHPGPYLRDAALRSAYTAYYLPVNAPKLWPVLDFLEARGAAPVDGARVLELGAGPGTGCVGAGLWAESRGYHFALHATDVLAEASSSARSLFDALGWRDAQVGVFDALGSAAEPAPADLLLMFNVVNELPESQDARLVERIQRLLTSTGTLVVVEPASKEKSRRVLAFRDACVAAGLGLLGPCTHNDACPMRGRSDDWCHAEWRFERPPYLRAVDQRIGHVREVLKATWFALSAAPCAPLGGHRVVSRRFDEKGRTRAQVCGADGLHTWELQHRDVTPANRDWLDVSRYDRIDLRAVASDRPGRLAPATRCARLSDDADASTLPDS